MKQATLNNIKGYNFNLTEQALETIAGLQDKQFQFPENTVSDKNVKGKKAEKLRRRKLKFETSF